MNASRLLRRLQDAGVQVRADDGDVVVGPSELLTPSLTDRIRSKKPELLDALEDGDLDPVVPPCIDCGRDLPLSGVRCPDCRDAHHEPTCASCGATIGGPDLSICDLCTIERQVAEIRERQGAPAKEEEPP